MSANSNDPDQSDKLKQHIDRARAGGDPKYRAQLKKQGKLFVRERIRLFFDAPTQVEDGLLAECLKGDLPADGVVTGIGEVHGRPVALIASDATVKAGSWGAKTVEKMIRLQETAMNLKIPLVVFEDAAGARITDQIEVFPGRRHAGHIFYLMIKYSGVAPQLTVLFGPSPAGAAYVPAFSDAVIMVEGNASAYLGSPRMAEMVIGEKVSLEDMGGARMHCTVSGLGDFLASDEAEAIKLAREYLAYMPQNYLEKPPAFPKAAPASARALGDIVPDNANRPFDMYALIEALADAGSFLEMKKLFAPELITGFARLNGRVVGLLANQPKVKAGVIFNDSSDKGARFCFLCNAYNIPLLFLCDVPGFMIGSQVERAGIIRHGAKFVAASAQATVPKICVVVRKCYGAGLYAMGGPAFGADATLALPSAQIAVMGPEAAVNAVYANQIARLPETERPAFVEQKRREYAEDIDVFRLASELIVDAVIPFERLREELIARYAMYANKDAPFSTRRNPVYPV